MAPSSRKSHQLKSKERAALRTPSADPQLIGINAIHLCVKLCWWTLLYEYTFTEATDMPLTNQEQADFSRLLTRTAENAAMYAALTRSEEMSNIGGETGYCAEPGYRLIRVDHRLDPTSDNEFEIALVDDAQLCVAYYMRITLSHIPQLSFRLVARHDLWRSAGSRHALVLRDISRKVLFSYVIRDYDLLLTEEKYTRGGKFYWFKQVSLAIELGLSVHAYDPSTQTLRAIPTQRMLRTVQDHAWSGAYSVSLLAIISNRGR
ncbi:MULTISPECIES: hypothetical protein [Pseudomonas]|uniref:hypothetical protein n=1 Tax=Pseudomonas TaxID=286 RepID=UPI00157649EF|nr:MULTISPECIES: hypothetical protein [Pseudomonas]MDD2122547.1 hypothetical protein [Pseudomonas monteilii]